MLETIYTIPVNEVFDECAENHSLGCPFCRLYDRLEKDELDLILGASMMEPEIRIKTNEKGFCPDHYAKMFERKNRLQLALMLESHLDKIKEDMDGNFLSNLVHGKGKNGNEKLETLEHTCYVCERIEGNLSKMILNSIYLYEVDYDKKETPFADKIAKQSYFCLPHYRRFIEDGRKNLDKKKFSDFYKLVSTLEEEYFSSLRADVSWFIKKFDYRYENEDWGNAKDSVQRAMAFLNGRNI